MIKVVAIMGIALTLPSCAVFDPFGYRREELRQPALINVPETYTKAEIDAINAEATCKALARNAIQQSRCGVRR
jgi:hypothetical protein